MCREQNGEFAYWCQGVKGEKSLFLCTTGSCLPPWEELNAPWYQGRYHTLSWIWQKETPSTEKKQGIIFFYPKMNVICLFVWFVCFVCLFFFCGGKGLYYKEFIYYVIFIYITLKFSSGCKHPVDSTRQHQVRWADIRSCRCLYSVASTY